MIGGAIDTPAAPSEGGEGRVVNGVGYTRVRPREASVAETGGDHAERLFRRPRDDDFLGRHAVEQ